MDNLDNLQANLAQVALFKSLGSNEAWLELEKILMLTRERLIKKHLEVDIRIKPGLADEIRGEIAMIDQIVGLVNKARHFDFKKAQEGIDKKKQLLVGFRR